MMRRTTCAIWVHPMPGSPSRQLSNMKSDWGISGRDGMNIMDTQTKRPLSPDPICFGPFRLFVTERVLEKDGKDQSRSRSEEHTSELQSPDPLVCRLLLEKKKIKQLHPAMLTT